MKLFRVTAKNHLRWTSDGKIDAEFYAIAPDLISAMIKAQEVVADLTEKLSHHKAANGLRVCALTELGDVVNDVVMEREPETESWVRRMARKVDEGDG